MPIIQIEDTRQKDRRATPTCWVGRVPLGGRHPVVVQSMTNTADRGRRRHRAAGRRAGRRRLRAGAGHGQHARGRRGGARDPPPPAGRRASRCRWWATSTTTATRCSPSTRSAPQRSTSTASTRATWACGEQHDENFRRMIEVAVGARQAGAHRRQLGLARPRAAHPADGRQRAPAASRCRTARWCSRRCARARCARRRWPSASASRTTASCCRPRSAACATWCRSTARSAAACDYPLHLGLTEAGLGTKGIVATTAALSDAAVRGDRRHHPHQPHPRARAATAPRRCGCASRSCSRSGIRDFTPQVTVVPGVRAHHRTFFQELADAGHRAPRRAHAGVAHALPRRGGVPRWR